MHIQRRTRNTFASLCLVFFLLALLSGCSDKVTQSLSGVVTLDGEAVKSGSIVFTPKGEGMTTGGKIVDGKYSIDVSPGLQRVSITASKPHPTRTSPNADPDGPPIPEMIESIPAIYNTESTLEVDANAGSTHDFELETPR